MKSGYITQAAEAMPDISDTIRSNVRVLYLVDSLRVGGKERQICELLKALNADQSIDALVVTMGTEQFYVAEIQKLGIPLVYLLRRFRWDPSVFTRLLRILREFRPDIIHTNSEMAMSYAWPLARLMGIRIINATLRNAFSGSGPRWQWHKLMLYLADARISNSQAGFASRGLHHDSRGNHVIYNGLDLNRFHSQVSVRRNESDLKADGRKVVGMVAEFSDYKDFPTFIRAAQSIVAKRDDVIFVMVGGGKNLEACRQLVVPGGDRIQFLGQRTDVEPLIQQMDIGVLCTFTEGISNSVMEYMAAGKPVVVTDGGGSAELIENGIHGFLVPQGEYKGVAEKIELLLDQSGQATRLGIAGR